MEFLIKPNDGVGVIKLGMSREQVKELLVQYFSSSDKTIDFYFNNSLQIEFENELVDFISISQSSAYKCYMKILMFLTLTVQACFML